MNAVRRAVTFASQFKTTPSRSFSSNAYKMAKEYKLKGVTAPLKLNEGQMQEAEVEGLQDAKVLLASHAGKVVAVGPKCTHFGAPLSKGVVTSEGRLTCPWHGACFSLKTGDVEDAPALDPIAKFELSERDGAVYVTGEEELLKAGRKPADLRCAAVGDDSVVIVGGGSGALGTYEQLRRDGFKGPITIISKEGVRPFDRTKLSKALLDDIEKVAWRSAEYLKQASVDLVDDEVTSVDFTGKSIKTKSGKTIPYKRLVLATGGKANSLPLPGLKIGELKNVFLLRTLADTQGINAAVGEKGKKVVVIGSSFIGLEVANALAGKGHEVQVVGMESAPAENAFGPKVGKIFQGLLEKNGIKFHMNASVEKATPSKSDSSSVGAVHLKGGVELPADAVIEGVGVKPATDFLQNSTGGPEAQKDGSILVDEKFRVKGLGEDVFAIGDIATYPYKGHNVRIEHWNVAQNAGRSVGKSIAQPKIAQKPFVPVFWSALGSQLRYCGHPVDGYDDVIIQGETSGDKMGWAAYYIKGDEVVAVATMQKDPIMVQSMELMRKGKMLNASDIKGGADLMSVQA